MSDFKTRVFARLRCFSVNRVFIPRNVLEGSLSCLCQFLSSLFLELRQALSLKGRCGLFHIQKLQHQPPYLKSSLQWHVFHFCGLLSTRETPLPQKRGVFDENDDIHETPTVGTEFWEGDATKQKSVKKSAFSLNGVQAFSE